MKAELFRVALSLLTLIGGIPAVASEIVVNIDSPQFREVVAAIPAFAVNIATADSDTKAVALEANAELHRLLEQLERVQIAALLGGDGAVLEQQARARRVDLSAQARIGGNATTKGRANFRASDAWSAIRRRRTGIPAAGRR